MIATENALSKSEKESAHDWLTNLFSIVDSKNAIGFSDYFIEEGRFVYGSSEPICGKQAIYNYVSGLFDTLESIKHTVFDAWRIADRVMGEVDVTYVFNDGRRFIFPAFVLYKMEGDLIRDYLIYIDPSPMYKDT